MNPKFVVLGANGNVGTPLVQILLKAGYQVKSVSRTGEAINGSEGFTFNFHNPSTLSTLFSDVDAAYIMLPSGNVDITELLLPVVEAAIANQTKVVFQSVLGADRDDNHPYRQVEIALEKSGIPYVILRPNWFADNFHTYWKAGILLGEIALPAAEGASSFIDVRDIAECAATALTCDTFDGKSFDLTGPEAVNYAEAAERISETIGRKINYSAITDEAFVEILTKAGVLNDYAQFLASIFYPVREGLTSAISPDVETLLGKAPRSLQTYLSDHAEDFKA